MKLSFTGVKNSQVTEDVFNIKTIVSRDRINVSKYANLECTPIKKNEIKVKWIYTISHSSGILLVFESFFNFEIKEADIPILDSQLTKLLNETYSKFQEDFRQEKVKNFIFLDFIDDIDKPLLDFSIKTVKEVLGKI